MGHITIHQELIWGSEESYQSLHSQHRRSPSCPEVGLWRPGPLGQQRPQGETNTQRLALLLCSFPLSLSFLLTHSQSL